MGHKYIEQRDGGYWVKDTRVSLDSIVCAFRDGLSPETIGYEILPSLTLEQVYGAIAFYLSNQKKIDIYMQQEESKYEEFRKQVNQQDPKFHKKLIQARRDLHLAQS